MNPPLVNRTEYRFDSVTFAEKVEGKSFAFRVPNGVSIIRATGE
ncbi:MAG: hypothetical protein AAFY60_02255 [Myxococcota bacterium]